MWAKVLKIAATDLDVTRALYDLGGDSLAAARIFAAVRKRFGRTLTMDRLPEVDTVRTMAHWLGASPAGKAGRAT